jgi:hypothetical protein
VIYKVTADLAINSRQCRIEGGVESAAKDGTFYVPMGYYMVPFLGRNFICKTNLPDAGGDSISSSDEPEPAVDRFIASMATAQPVIEISLDTCAFFVYPSNRVAPADYQSDADHPFKCSGRIRVTGS